MFKFFFSIVCCCFFTGAIWAQDSRPLRRVKPIAVIPFKILNGGIIILEAKIEGKTDTLNFVFDTGSGSISIDSTTAVYLNLTSKASNRNIKGIGGAKRIRVVDSINFKINAIEMPNTEFFINDYANISEYYGVKIDGIVGYNFISKYVLKIDYNYSKIYVYPKGEYSYGRGHTMPIFVRGIPEFTISVKGDKTNKGKYIFDTGGDMQLILAENFQKDSSLINPKQKMVETFAEGFGGRSLMKLTTVKKISFAGYSFANVPTYIYQDSVNVIDYPYRKGIVGNEILKRFNIVLNYEKNEVHFTPNKYFLEPFAYGFTGLDLYLIDGQIYAGSIGKGTPAEEAGILENDQIMGIDKNFSNVLSEYKELLQKNDQTLNIFIERNGKSIILKLKVGSFRQ
jgi:hypothetical protein